MNSMNHPSGHHRKSHIPAGAFAVGALAGIIAGILFAPRAGKQTREHLKAVSIKIRDDLAKRLQELKELTRDKYESTVDSVVTTYEKLKDVTSQEAKEIRQELKEGYDRFADAAKKTTDTTPKEGV